MTKENENLNEFEKHFKKLGNKEHVLWYLFDKVVSSSEVDEKLELKKNITQNIYKELIQTE